MKFKNRIVLPSLLLVSALAGIGHAGYRERAAVSIDLGGQTALGSLATVRASSNATEQLGCTVHAYNSYTKLTCLGVTTTGTTLACSTVNPAQNLINAVNTLQGDSWLGFRVEGRTGKCIELKVTNSSIYEPKVVGASLDSAPTPTLPPMGL